MKQIIKHDYLMKKDDAHASEETEQTSLEIYRTLSYNHGCIMKQRFHLWYSKTLNLENIKESHSC